MITAPTPVLVVVLAVMAAQASWVWWWMLRERAADTLWRAWDDLGREGIGGDTRAGGRATLEEVIDHFQVRPPSRALEPRAPSPWTFTAIWLARRNPGVFADTPRVPVPAEVDDAIAKALLVGSPTGWCWAAALWVRAACRRAGRGAVLATASRVVAEHRRCAAAVRAALGGAVPEPASR